MSESDLEKAGKVLVYATVLSAVPERRTFLSHDDGRCQVYASSPRASLNQPASS